MPIELSLVVKGTWHANADGSNRQFEIAMLHPGEPVALMLEPTNKADPSAVAVYSVRGYQIGYLSAERCGFVGAKIREGRDVRAVFQQRTADGGALIRANLDGTDPTLPPPALAAIDPIATAQMSLAAGADPDSGFYPDFIPPDE